MSDHTDSTKPSMGHQPGTSPAPSCSSAYALEYELAFMVRRMEAMRRQFHFGMERAHYLLLSLLEREDRQSVGKLANQVNLDASTVTRQVAAMIKAGLVEKHDNPDDRRGGFVAITEQGQTAARQARQRRLAKIEQAFEEWSEEDRREFARLAARYNEQLRCVLNEGE